MGKPVLVDSDLYRQVHSDPSAEPKAFETPYHKKAKDGSCLNTAIEDLKRDIDARKAIGSTGNGSIAANAPERINLFLTPTSKTKWGMHVCTEDAKNVLDRIWIPKITQSQCVAINKDFYWHFVEKGMRKLSKRVDLRVLSFSVDEFKNVEKLRPFQTVPLADMVARGSAKLDEGSLRAYLAEKKRLRGLLVPGARVRVLSTGATGLLGFARCLRDLVDYRYC